MFDNIYYDEYHRKTFLERYTSFSKLLVIFVFADFLLRRISISSGVLNFNKMAIILLNANYFIILSILFAIVFYRFYNKFFSKDIFTAVIGCLVLFISTIILIFIKSDNNLFKILSIIFYILLIVIFYKSIMPSIKRTDIKERDRFLFIFMLLYLCSSAIRFLVSSTSYLVFKTFLKMYFLYDLHAYFIRLSSYSFIVFSFIYFYIFFNRLSKKRIIATILSVIAIFIIFLAFKANLYSLLMYSLEALKIEIILSSYIYVIFIMILLIASFSNAIYKNKNSSIIYLFFLVIAGINITDLFNLILILFVITDINN